MTAETTLGHFITQMRRAQALARLPFMVGGSSNTWPGWLVATLGVMTLGGCGGSTQDTEHGGEESGGSSSGDFGSGGEGSTGAGGRGGSSASSGGAREEGVVDIPGESGLGRLTVPVAPLTENSLVALLQDAEDGFYRAATTVDLALGEEYPDEFLLDLRDVWVVAGRCSSPTEDGWTIDAVSGAPPSYVEIVDDALLFHLSEMRTDELIVTGRIDTHKLEGDVDCDVEDALDFELQLNVRARFPARAEFRFPSYCAQAPALLAGQPGFGGYLVLWEHEGSTLSPLNATQQRPYTVRIIGTEDTELSLPDGHVGFGELRARGPEQTLLLESDAGASALHLVTPSDIDRIDTSWLASVGRTTRALTTGDQFERRELDIVDLYVGAHGFGASTLCRSIPNEYLELSTTSPDVCTVAEGATHVEVHGWGVCAAELHLPGFHGGAGLSDRLAIDFLVPIRERDDGSR